MKIPSIILLAILTVALCACNSGDDPVSPPSMNRAYQVEFITAPMAGAIGWTCDVQYLGVPNGFMGRFNVNTQSKTIDWTSEFDPSSIVQLSLVDAQATPIATFLIDNEKYVRTIDGVSVTFLGMGWDEYSTNVWHVQLDCR